MSIVKWDPLKNLVALQDRMNRLFDETLEREHGSEGLMAGAWAPPVDIYETDNDVVIVAELPGIEEKDVDVQVRDNVLTIKGERKMEKSLKEESYHRVERTYGSFSRSFTLPTSVNQDKISATYTRGVLEIKMPKAEQAEPQQIKIQVKE
jgi:HSP20 family protein